MTQCKICACTYKNFKALITTLKTRSMFSASIGMHILQKWTRAQTSRMKVSKKPLMSSLKYQSVKTARGEGGRNGFHPYDCK